jgi:predicted deacetylase
VPLPDRAVCVVLHDVAPATWPACEKLLHAIDALGRIPLTLLVVPEYHHGQAIDASPAFIRAVGKRLAQGDEAAMHGCFHRDDGLAAASTPMERFKRQVYTAGEGEFAALDEAGAQARLALGIAKFENLGWPVHGFVAPAWLLSPGSRAALSASPFLYTSTRRHLYTLPDWEPSGTPSLVWSVRSDCRRRASSVFNRYLRRSMRDTPLLRLGLHPADAAYPDVVQFWIDTLRSSLATHVPMTKAAWLGVAP